MHQTIKRPGISHTTVRRVVDTVLRAEGYSDASVSVQLVGEKRMHTLNRRYRGKDRPTDVISFAAQDGEPLPGVNMNDLGDIFLCPPYLRRQARRFRVPFREEAIRMLVHGVLHTLGYDHVTKVQADRMFPKQEMFVEQLV